MLYLEQTNQLLKCLSKGALCARQSNQPSPTIIEERAIRNKQTDFFVFKTHEYVSALGQSLTPEYLVFSFVRFERLENTAQCRVERETKQSWHRIENGFPIPGIRQKRLGQRGMPSTRAQATVPSYDPAAEMFQRQLLRAP
jgi:hypothetical protein